MLPRGMEALENGTDFLAPGCGVAPQTPLENILQLQKARNDYFAKTDRRNIVSSDIVDWLIR